MKRTKQREVAEELGGEIMNRLIAGGWVKVPPGWRLVPEVPTPEQMIAASNSMNATRKVFIAIGDDEGVGATYHAMVKAAPAPFASIVDQQQRKP